MTSNLLKNTANDLSKLDYSVLVEQKESGYQATVWDLPDYYVKHWRILKLSMYWILIKKLLITVQNYYIKKFVLVGKIYE
ncbi:hypothetical protein [Nostoc sp. ChiSLP03a]|uniref:hypothetical protein n=1 Tax=Nostoc sp. ChiSLP03a TaxID=3075380 RepID=UPI002AD429C5|nr:hypothetical protein [Nostoc sp. ChiSLP03a]MDZ8212550.1 hypothetical protein [Nostoc sp. ChiSLP03a]